MDDREAAVTTAGQKAVRAFAILIGIFVILSAFFVERDGKIDEIGLWNPPYMLSHFGKISYPIYGFFQSTIVHPPLHTGMIGLLNRWHLSWYYAEAVPTACFFLLSIFVIVRAPFPVPVQLGLLYSIGILMTYPFAIFITRPEGDLQAAWFMGLVLLESGRLKNWNRWELFAGACIVTFAAEIHYYGLFACLAVAVYAGYAIRSLGWKNAKPQVWMLAAGACLAGIPYTAFYVLPNFKEIVHFISITEATQGVAYSIAKHEALYAEMRHSGNLPVWLRLSMSTRLPMLVFSIPILYAIRSTRGIALASLPFLLFMFFLAGHKLDSYLMHEFSILEAAVACGTCVAIDWAWKRIAAKRIHWLAAPVSALLIAAYLCHVNPVLSDAVVSAQPRVHEGDLARAASRKILGPHATVGGRLCMWYASGADHWYDISSDLLYYPDLKVEPKEYFRNFDALAEDQHMSYVTGNKQRGNLPSWYADGTLKLRGFFFAEANKELQFLLLSAQAPPQVTGYGIKNGQLYRFEASQQGDYGLVSAVCPTNNVAIGMKRDAMFGSILFLPGPQNGDPASGDLLTVVLPLHGETKLPQIEQTCRVVDRIPGTIYLDNRSRLAETLASDTPMHFDRELKSLPSYIGAGILKP
jgi:hypothetical protein